MSKLEKLVNIYQRGEKKNGNDIPRWIKQIFSFVANHKISFYCDRKNHIMTSSCNDILGWMPQMRVYHLKQR